MKINRCSSFGLATMSAPSVPLNAVGPSFESFLRYHEVVAWDGRIWILGNPE